MQERRGEVHIRSKVNRVCTFRLCRSRRARAESPVHVALPLHFKYPSPETKSGPDGRVSAVTGFPETRIEAQRQGKGLNGQSFADGSPGNCWQRIEPWGCSRYLGTLKFKNAASKVGG